MLFAIWILYFPLDMFVYILLGSNITTVTSCLEVNTVSRLCTFHTICYWLLLFPFFILLLLLHSLLWFNWLQVGISVLSAMWASLVYSLSTTERSIQLICWFQDAFDLWFSMFSKACITIHLLTTRQLSIAVIITDNAWLTTESKDDTVGYAFCFLLMHLINILSHFSIFIFH